MHKPHTRFVQLGFRRYSTRKSSVFLCGWILCNMSRLILEGVYLLHVIYNNTIPIPSFQLELSCLSARKKFIFSITQTQFYVHVVPLFLRSQSRLSEVSSFVQERDPIKLSKDRSIKELPSISLEGEYGCTLESTSSSWGDEPNE